MFNGKINPDNQSGEIKINNNFFGQGTELKGKQIPIKDDYDYTSDPKAWFETLYNSIKDEKDRENARRNEEASKEIARRKAEQERQIALCLISDMMICYLYSFPQTHSSGHSMQATLWPKSRHQTHSNSSLFVPRHSIKPPLTPTQPPHH